MSKIEILRWDNDEVIFSHACENNSIKVTLEEGVMNGMSFEYANLKYAHLYNANLKNANLKHANLENANLENANLYNAKLYNANLKHANIKHAYLKGVNLDNANLEGANLKNVDLKNVNLQGVNLKYANLKYANLQGANLEGANLEKVRLVGTIGNGKEIISMNLHRYHVTITTDVIQIGCKRHTPDEWRNFTDEEIEAMDGGALEWWKENKIAIFKIISTNFGKYHE